MIDQHSRPPKAASCRGGLGPLWRGEALQIGPYVLRQAARMSAGGVGQSGRELRRRRRALPLAAFEVPTMALNPTGVLVPPPHGQQNQTQGHHNQQKLLHDTSSNRFAAIECLNMAMTGAPGQPECCDNATKSDADVV